MTLEKRLARIGLVRLENPSLESNHGKTPLMRLVEQQTGRELEDLLLELYHERKLTLAAISDRVGVPLPTVAAWMAKFRLSRAALARRALESLAIGAPVAQKGDQP